MELHVLQIVTPEESEIRKTTFAFESRRIELAICLFGNQRTFVGYGVEHVTLLALQTRILILVDLTTTEFGLEFDTLRSIRRNHFS
jgi:hypothetical protein